MDPNEGEDSGLEFQDHSVLDDYQHEQVNFNPEIDEGIVLEGVGGSNPQLNQQPPIPIDPMVFQLGEGDEFMFLQQGFPVQGEELNILEQPQQILLDPAMMNPQFIPQEQQQQGAGVAVVDGAGAVAAPPQVVDDLGDANNNDRPDDFNNNTTDPEMQMRQLQIQQQRQQQQQPQHPPQQQQQYPEGGGEGGGGGDQGVPSAIVNLALTETGSPFIIDKKGAGGKKDKRKKKKKKKRNRLVTIIGPDGNFIKKELVEGEDRVENGERDENDEPEAEGVEIEYVPEKLELSVFDPMYKAFANVFENFRITDLNRTKGGDEDSKPKAEELAKALSKVPKIDDEEDEEKKEEEKPKISKRKLKQLTRLSIAELKQVVARPDVVEMQDVTAADPKLLVHLKAYRNTVPVPRHWCYKRKYLQGKRGIEKPPFDLPGFIKKTGIMEMRAAIAEKEEIKTLKSKMREKVRPKMGKIDIDYQKLHDAFFKWQSKPKMSIHGDLYYEGKEFETRMKDKKPGDLSDDLRTALGMPIGPNSHRVPPPWLIAMQRYGPPPTYPHLKIPGLNAPIPDGCSFGYHAGGWGKPPVDEFGRPLYGDVFGVVNPDGSTLPEEEYIDRGLWGELESEEEVESEEEEEAEDEEKEEGEGGEKGEKKIEESGLQTPAGEGLATPSGFSSVPAGLETPELIELRKRRIEQDMEGGDTPALYTVLPEKRVDRISGAMMASTHIYDVGAAKEKGKTDTGRIELALDPSELDLDTDAMAARYEQTIKERAAANAGEDLSDMVAEHAAKQKTKRKRQQDPKQQGSSSSKKHKEFKF